MTLSPEDAEVFFDQAVAVLESLDDEGDLTRAVPKAVMNRGEAMAMLAGFIALLAQTHPHIPMSPDVLELAESYYREIH